MLSLPLLVLPLGGCSPRLPSASLDDIALVSVDLEHAEAELTFAVDNPLPAEVRISALQWQLVVNGRTLADGALDDPPVLAANRITTIAVPVSVRYADVAGALGEGVRNAPYGVSAAIDVDTPLGTYTLPVEHRGVVPGFTLPGIDVLEIGFGRDGTALRMDLALHVALPPSVAVGELQWTLSVSDHTVARGAATLTDDGTLSMPMWFYPSDAAWASMIAVYERRATITMGIEGRLASPLGTVPVEITRTLELGGAAPEAGTPEASP